jgi:hypothetical protein
MIDLIFEDSKIREHLDYQKSYDSIWRHIKDNNQPMMKNPNTGHNIGFRKNLAKWFIDNNIEYKLSWISNLRTCISFEKMSDLILFKLTWC